MKSYKTKDIIGIVFFTLLIFATHLLDVTSENNGLIYGFGGLFFALAGAAKMTNIWFGKDKRRRDQLRADWRTDHAKLDAKDSKRQMDHYKNLYSNLSMSNPYLNMEKSMEDLTINQQKVALERQTFQQSQRNILNTMKQGVGGSGVASLAQALVRQGQAAQQQFSANIAKQESENRILALRQREAIDRLGREGKRIPIDFRTQQIGAMMGMTQQQYAADKDLEQQYHASTMNQASARIQSGLSALRGFMPG